MTTRKSMLTAFGAILGLVLAAGSVRATTDNKLMYVTFSGPVSLPGVTLGTGTYTFELVDSDVTRDLVRVRNKDRSQVYFTNGRLAVAPVLRWSSANLEREPRRPSRPGTRTTIGLVTSSSIRRRRVEGIPRISDFRAGGIAWMLTGPTRSRRPHAALTTNSPWCAPG
jgi:hypothetical protein